LSQWRSKGGASGGAGLGGATALFLQPFKTRFKQIFRPKYA